MGMYISSDPIGLAGNNPTLYGYVQDVNTWLDPWGLKCKKAKSSGFMQRMKERDQAPIGIDRFDKPHTEGQLPHVHFDDGTSLNVDGTIHDKHKGIPNPTKKQRDFLEEYGWKTN